jgi:hypothetical protein
MKQDWPIGMPVWLLGLLLSLHFFLSAAWAWDGNWTEAKSGQGDVIYDPDSSQGKAGTDPPQKFLTPNPRDYADVDPEELDDYYHRRNKDYSPYALARITQDLHYNNIVIPKGYYLVKPGDVNDGSPRVNLKTLNQAAPNQSVIAAESQGEVGSQLAPLYAATDPGSTGTANPQPIPETNPKLNKDAPVYSVFVLKRQGKVIGVVPINRMESYKPPRDQKIPKQALAWMEIEDRHPVLKFYFKKQLYCTDFQ